MLLGSQIICVLAFAKMIRHLDKLPNRLYQTIRQSDSQKNYAEVPVRQSGDQTVGEPVSLTISENHVTSTAVPLSQSYSYILPENFCGIVSHAAREINPLTMC